MKVSIFGGSQPKPGEKAYQEAFELGNLLGKAGHTVLSGGYIGAMEAVSRGAAEAGAHVIGVTCDEIEKWRSLGANPWVKEEWRRATLKERLFTLIEACDAAIALPGGPGTLLEIAALWNPMIIGALHRRPLILVGDGWQAVFDQVYKSLGEYIPANQRELVQFAPDVRSAIKMLES